MSNLGPAIAPLPGDDRLTAFPISRQSIWDLYKEATTLYWVPGEIDLSKDLEDYQHNPLINDNIRRAIDHVLAFFASLDKLVNINIVERFKKDFAIYEIDCFYDFQVMMENIHGEAYSEQLDTIIVDRNKRQHLLDSVRTIPVVERMAGWIRQCIDMEAPTGERLLRMACVEGVFFMSAFALIYWLQDMGVMKGLSHANGLISKDENLHTRFALHLYTLLTEAHKIPQDRIREIFRSADDIAEEFYIEAIPVNMPGMNAKLMRQYIEYQTDTLLSLIDVPPIYRVENPFYFMARVGMAKRGNFFETRNSDYSKPKENSSHKFDIAEDF